MSGQPNSFLRLGYPEFDTGAFTDDDFVYYNNVTTEFQEFMEGPYSVILKYTGLRWLGKSKASFVHNNEKDYIFLSNAFLCHLFPDAN